MPNKWDGTIEDRLAKLENSGRRCDAQDRHCTRSAVNEYTVIRCDGDFNPLPDAGPEKKKCCSWHRKVFTDNGLWKVVGDRELVKADPYSDSSRAKRLRGSGHTD